MNRALSPHFAKQGWRAHLQLGFRAGEEKTVLAHRQRVGPLTVQRPFYPEDQTCHVYLLHPPGGIVGGDEIELDITVEADAAALVTTPGATKFYRSAGKDALVTNRFCVSGDLEWLPQETIVFDQALLTQSTTIDLDQNARFIGWEMLCLGRPASAELFEQGEAIFSTRINRLGVPLLIERLPLGSDMALNGASCLRGHRFVATMLVTPATDAMRDEVIAYVTQTEGDALLGITLLDQLLAIRYLGDDANLCRARFTAIWQLLRPRVFGRPALLPRIWNT